MSLIHNFYLMKAISDNALYSIDNIDDFMLNVFNSNENSIIESIELQRKCTVDDSLILLKWDNFTELPTMDPYSFEKNYGLNYHGVSIIPYASFNVLRGICRELNITSLLNIIEIGKYSSAYRYYIFHFGI